MSRLFFMGRTFHWAKGATVALTCRCLVAMVNETTSLDLTGGHLGRQAFSLDASASATHDTNSATGRASAQVAT
jgi:hypothetical protein